MKIIAAKDSDISNFEVYQHMLNQEYKFKQPDRRKEVPRNVKTMVKEVRILLCYLALALFTNWTL